MNNDTRRSLMLKVFIVLAIVVGAIFGWIEYQIYHYGSIEVIITTPTLNGTSVELNGTPLKLTGSQNTYRVPSGKKIVTVSYPGFYTSSIPITVAGGKTTVIYPSLSSEASASSTVSNNQIDNSLAKVISSGFLLKKAVYFDENAWAVLMVSDLSNNNPAIIIVQYAGGSGWKIVVGPGTFFGKNEAQKLPSDVVSYLIQQQYLNPTANI